jgi:hypothetical protein
MEKLVIVIHPSADEQSPVLALDALEQGADLLRLLEAVSRYLAPSDRAVSWRLLRASTNSPLTLEVGVDEDTHLTDVDEFLKAARDGLTSGLREIAEAGSLPSWLYDDLRPVVRNVFSRTQESLGAVEIGNGNGKRFTIDHQIAEKATIALDSIPSITTDVGVTERAVWGELEGTIVAVATWYGRPAFRIWSRQLVKPIPCIVPPDLVEAYGGEHTIKDVWTNKRVAVRGRIIYRRESVARILATDVRDVPRGAPLDIDLIRDPDFTSGLDPVEYLRRFYEGELIG